MSQADYDKHVPLGEKPTPGHGEKVCAERHELTYSLWTENQGRWYYGLKDGVNFRTVHCPACGIRLVPDEEPLPVPEGCGSRAEFFLHPTGEATIQAGIGSQRTWYLCGPAARVKPAWRRMFGERK